MHMAVKKLRAHSGLIVIYSNFKDCGFTEVKREAKKLGMRRGCQMSIEGNTKRVPFLAKMLYKL